MCLGIPGKIIEILDQDGMRMGKIDFDGVTRLVCLAALPEAQVGEYTIVHAGFGISLMNEQEALLTLETLREIADLNAELNIDTNAEPDRDRE